MSKDPWDGIRGMRCAVDGAAARARAFQVAASALHEALSKQAARNSIFERVTAQQRAFYRIESIPVFVSMGKNVREAWGKDIIAGLQIKLDKENDDALMVCAIERQYCRIIEMPNPGHNSLKKVWPYYAIGAIFSAACVLISAWMLS